MLNRPPFPQRYLSFLLTASCINLALFTAGSCSRNRAEGEEPLARVNNQTITLRELQQDTDKNILSLGETAEQWIDEQVLIQHAEKTNILKERELSTILRNHERKLMSRILLDSLLKHYIRIDPERMREFYANNVDSIYFKSQAALVTHLSFRKRDEALASLDILQSNPAKRDSILNYYNYDRQLVSAHMLMPELSEAIFQSEINHFVGPIRTSFGYHIIIAERFFNSGETIPYTFVRRQIYERLFQQQMPLARSSVLDSLREMMEIEVYYD